jgi:hypothetical protein
MEKNGCYIFKTPDGLTFILSLKALPVCKMKFILEKSKESVFYYFYGLDYQNEEPELKEQILEYFKADSNYPPLDIHPCLQGSNFDRIKKYPKLYNRIIKLDVKYDKRNFEDINC